MAPRLSCARPEGTIGMNAGSTLLSINLRLVAELGSTILEQYTYDQVESAVQDVLEKDVLCRPRSTFSLDADLTDDLRIDSDDISFIFIPELEERFGLDIPASEWRQVVTGRDAAKLLFRYLGART